MPDVSRKRKSPSSDDGGSASSSSSRRSARPSSSSSSSSSPSLAAPSSSAPSPFLSVQPSSIRNRMKRLEVYAKQKYEKKMLHAKERKKRQKATAALGEEEKAAKREADAKRQKTIESTREADDTVVQEGDEEVQKDEAMDEFSAYFTGEQEPKIIITTCYHPTKRMFDFIRDLLHVFPNSFYYARKQFEIRHIARVSAEKGFTDVMIVNEDKKELTSLTHMHLPAGPTAAYRLSSVRLCSEISHHGTPTAHRPEVLLNHFNTRLGHRVGRMLGALFHQQPQFRGRRVATFHNQRDYIFFRHHRYVFNAKDRVGLQELGPRFTLKLQWLQQGLFDADAGEFEYKHKTEMDTSRRRFFL